VERVVEADRLASDVEGDRSILPAVDSEPNRMVLVLPELEVEVIQLEPQDPPNPPHRRLDRSMELELLPLSIRLRPSSRDPSEFS